jgi:hypothetical protein
MNERQKTRDNFFRVFQKHFSTISSDFDLLEYNGVITIDKKLDKQDHVSLFREENKEKFKDFDIFINDENFSKKIDDVRIGDQFEVFTFSTTSKKFNKRIEFLNSLNSTFLGILGQILVFEQKLETLTKGYCYQSIQKKHPLFRKDGIYCLPVLDVPLSKEVYRFLLLPACCSLMNDDAFIVFYKIHK